MAEEDPQKLAGALEREADDLATRSQELHHEVDEVRQDWKRKRSDESVPGAPPPEHDDDEGAADAPADV